METTGAARPSDGPQVDPRIRRFLPVFLAVAAGLIVLGLFGNVFFAWWANEHPLWLVAIYPANRSLLAAAPQVAAWAFFAVAFTRLVLTDPMHYVIGLGYGERVRDWLKQEGAYVGFVAWVDRNFPRFGPVIVFAIPNNTVCMVAGTTKMRVPVFIAANISGTLTRLVLFYWAGEVWEDQILSVLDFMNRYRWQFTIGFFVLVVAQSMWSQRRGGSELAAMRAAIEEERESEESDDAESDTPTRD